MLLHVQKEEAIRIMAENTERKKAMESVINDEQQGARELREWRLNHDPVCHARLVKAKDFLENGHASLATAPVCTSKINDEINETRHENINERVYYIKYNAIIEIMIYIIGFYKI